MLGQERICVWASTLAIAYLCFGDIDKLLLFNFVFVVEMDTNNSSSYRKKCRTLWKIMFSNNPYFLLIPFSNVYSLQLYKQELDSHSYVYLSRQFTTVLSLIYYNEMSTKLYLFWNKFDNFLTSPVLSWYSDIFANIAHKVNNVCKRKSKILV